jgi:hypothetical protein
MSTIDLKFSPEMAEKVLAGEKCCTSRRTVKGTPGDEFEIDGVRFRLLDVLSMSIRTVVMEFCRAEGFERIDDCAAALQTFYPDLPQYDVLNVHLFARLPEDD